MRDVPDPGPAPIGRPSRHRAKVLRLTPGATRLQLLGLVRQLEEIEGRVAARLERERHEAERLEEQRLLRLERERDREREIGRLRQARRVFFRRRVRRLTRQFERRQRSALRDLEWWAHEGERRGFALSLEEAIASEMLTEEQRATRRLEEQIVTWLIAEGPEG